MATSLPLTKYHQVYLVLREQLAEGRFAHGLPSELDLTRQFDVGRVTVRRALELLAQEGLIVRQAGRGTRPTSRNELQARQALQAETENPATRLTGLLGNIVRVSRDTTVKVLDWRVILASDSLAATLQVPPGSKIRKATRSRSTQAGPVSHITTYCPEALVLKIGRRELTRKPILQLLEESGIELGRAWQTLSARQADAQVAKELEVAVGSALLSVKRLVFDASDRPVLSLHGLYRPDRYEYQMALSQVGGIDAQIVAKELRA